MYRKLLIYIITCDKNEIKASNYFIAAGASDCSVIIIIFLLYYYYHLQYTHAYLRFFFLFCMCVCLRIAPPQLYGPITEQINRQKQEGDATRREKKERLRYTRNTDEQFKWMQNEQMIHWKNVYKYLYILNLIILGYGMLNVDMLYIYVYLCRYISGVILQH